MSFAPPYQPNNSNLDLLFLLTQMQQKGAAAPKMGLGNALGGAKKLGVLGGGGAAGASLFGGGAGGVGAAGAADLGIAAPSMMIPEMTPLAPSMASGGGAAAGLGGTAAGLSPMLGMAGVAAAPLLGSMLGKAMIGKDPYKRREYSSQDFGKRSNLAIKGFDKTDENTRRQIGDKLREYKGKQPLTVALDKINGSSSSKGDWNFELPDVAQKKVNANLFGGDNKWGTVGSQQNLMKQHSATDLFNMGASELNGKHREQLGNILGQVDDLIKKGQSMGVQPTPAVKPMGHTVNQIRGKR